MVRMCQQFFSRCTQTFSIRVFLKDFANLCKILFWGPVTNEVLHGLKSISEEGEPERIIVKNCRNIVKNCHHIVINCHHIVKNCHHIVENGHHIVINVTPLSQNIRFFINLAKMPSRPTSGFGSPEEQ